MEGSKTVVMKFGGAACSTVASLKGLALLLEKRIQKGDKCVAVVSAMGDTTDRLLALARLISNIPPKRECDMLISVGERVSGALLAMALQERNCASASLTGSQAGIMTTSDHGLAKIVDVRPIRVKEMIEKGVTPIIAGFQGVSLEKDITTLGRGGSDTSAVALAVALEADLVEFYKDVDGVYTSDPKESLVARRLDVLDYDQAIQIAMRAGVIDPRAISLAKVNAIPLHVLSYIEPDSNGTIISGDDPTTKRLLFEEVVCKTS